MSFAVKLESRRLRQALMKVLGSRFKQEHWQAFWRHLKNDGAAIETYTLQGELIVNNWAYREDWPLARTCKDHPRYKAKRKPSSACEVCWSIWLQSKDQEILDWIRDQEALERQRLKELREKRRRERAAA